MASRITGPDGRALSSVPDASQPQMPVMDIKQTEDGPTFRLPVVAVGFMQPDVIAAIASAVASLIVQEIAGVAAKATEHVEST